MFSIYPIVEGQGEERAVPVLLRRIAGELFERHDIHVFRPHRVHRGLMISPDPTELRKAIELGSRRIKQGNGVGGILVLLDADDDCPATSAPAILGRVARPDVPIRVVMAKREYEAWFLAAFRSFVEQAQISPNAVPPSDPESIRDAKRHLQRCLAREHAIYRPTVDQPALTARLDLREARGAAPSFDKLCRDLCGLLAAAQ